MSTRTVSALASSLLLFSLTPAAHGAVILASANRAGFSGNGNSTNASVSANGMVVAFQSDASDLVDGDQNISTDVFLFDVPSRTTRLVSMDVTGTKAGRGTSRGPIVSADGRFVAFTSDANDLVSTPVSRNGDVFVRDVATGQTTLVSINRTGDRGGNAESTLAAMSSDGQVIVFLSQATDLVGLTDNNSGNDVFVRDMRSGTTQLVSMNRTNDGTANQDSFDATISANGRYVAFATLANNVISSDPNTSSDIFIRDLGAGRTALASATPGNQPSNRGAFRPSLSADGKLVAFDSISSDLTTNDANGNDSDIFARNLTTNSTTLISINMDGTSTKGDSFGPAVVSGNGAFVAFTSPASNLVANDTNGTTDAFVRDLAARQTILLNSSPSGTGGNGSSTAPSISTTGRYAAFLTTSSNLGFTDTNGKADVYLKDVTTGAVRLISANPAGVAANGTAARPKISADGRVVAFESTASDMVPGDTNARTDVFVALPDPGPRTRAVKH